MDGIWVWVLLAVGAALVATDRLWRRAMRPGPLDERSTGDLEELVGNAGGCVSLLLATVVAAVLMWVLL